MMMRRLRSQYLPSRLRAVAQATAAAAIVVAATAAAPQALAVSTPGWRVSAVFGPRTGVTYIHGFVATSRTDAWATVSSCAPCGGPGEAVTQWIERWSGRSWLKITGPQVSMFAGGFLAASSATDAWLFSSAAQRIALRWNGRRWTVKTVPPWVVRNGGRSGIVNATTADFSPSDLWVFSSGNEKTPFAARYRNGHRSKVILPAFAVQVSAVAPDDIWATVIWIVSNGPKPRYPWFFDHLNGGRWSRQ